MGKNYLGSCSAPYSTFQKGERDYASCRLELTLVVAVQAYAAPHPLAVHSAKVPQGL